MVYIHRRINLYIFKGFEAALYTTNSVSAIMIGTASKSDSMRTYVHVCMHANIQYGRTDKFVEVTTRLKILKIATELSFYHHMYLL